MNSSSRDFNRQGRTPSIKSRAQDSERELAERAREVARRNGIARSGVTVRFDPSIIRRAA